VNIATTQVKLHGQSHGENAEKINAPVPRSSPIPRATAAEEKIAQLVVKHPAECRTKYPQNVENSKRLSATDLQQLESRRNGNTATPFAAGNRRFRSSCA
jgi:hypothetical protein